VCLRVLLSAPARQGEETWNQPEVDDGPPVGNYAAYKKLLKATTMA
jgi:hypothetical protein